MFARIIIITSAILFSFLGCKQHAPNTSIVKRQSFAQPDTLKKDESGAERSYRFTNQENKMYDTMGIKIGEIHFPINVKPTSSFLPVISIDNPSYILRYLIKGDDVVLPKKVTLAVEYPVAKPVYFELTAKGEGFTRKQIVEEISRVYHEIYKVEEETSKTKTVPLEKREGLINRNETNGKYGIWGHDLSDLYLNFIDVYKNRDGVIFLDLDIDS